jgi:hypothetical protein
MRVHQLFWATAVVLLPFASPDEVKRIEPEVPWENIEAYVLACKEYRG